MNDGRKREYFYFGTVFHNLSAQVNTAVLIRVLSQTLILMLAVYFSVLRTTAELFRVGVLKFV